MRTKPLIGKKAWFGPERFGWGLAPVTWEGWLATFVFVALAVGGIGVVSERVAAPGAFSMTVAFCVFATLKGTSFGGRREYEIYRQMRGDRRR